MHGRKLGLLENGEEEGGGGGRKEGGESKGK